MAGFPGADRPKVGTTRRAGKLIFNCCSVSGSLWHGQRTPFGGQAPLVPALAVPPGSGTGLAG